MLRKRALAVFAAGVLMVGLAGVPASASDAMVRVAHWSPDAPAVDVYVDGSAVLADVPFGAVSGYLTLPAGEYPFAVRVAGSAPDADPVFAATATLAGGSVTTVAAIGTVSPFTIGPALIADDLSSTAPGRAHVRAIHAIPDVGMVDITTSKGAVLASGVGFGDATGYLSVRPGTHMLQVRAAGTSTVLLTIKARVAPGSVTTIAAIGEAGEGTAMLRAYTDRAPSGPMKFAG